MYELKYTQRWLQKQNYMEIQTSLTAMYWNYSANDETSGFWNYIKEPLQRGVVLSPLPIKCIVGNYQYV